LQAGIQGKGWGENGQPVQAEGPDSAWFYRAEQAAENVPRFVILSEAKNLSSILVQAKKQ